MRKHRRHTRGPARPKAYGHGADLSLDRIQVRSPDVQCACTELAGYHVPDPRACDAAIS